jgi:hypothetical protein
MKPAMAAGSFAPDILLRVGRRAEEAVMAQMIDALKAAVEA